MLTRRLWRVLRTPPDEPSLFAYIAGQPSAPPWYIFGIEAIGLLLVVPMMIFTSSVYGIGWAVSISGALAEERQRERYDLLCMILGGTLAVNTGLCRACLHRNRTFSNMTSRETWLGRTIIAAAIGLYIINESLVQNDTLTLLLLLSSLVLLALITYFDHMYSTVLCSLLGMLIPTYTRNRGDAQFMAFLSFLVLQILTYTLTLLAIMLLYPGFLIAAHLISLLLYVGLREGCVWLLWRLLAKRLGADSKELDFHMWSAV